VSFFFTDKINKQVKTKHNGFQPNTKSVTTKHNVNQGEGGNSETRTKETSQVINSFTTQSQ